MTESFNVNVRVREGDATSVILFNFVLDYFTRKLDTREKPTKLVSINAYEDDVVIISRNLKDLEEALQELDNTAPETGLIIKIEKTIYIYDK
jgi:hypothetical protein